MSVTLQPNMSQEMDIVESHASHTSETEAPSVPNCAKHNERPPPVQSVADWKIILHLPEIDTWIRSTSERVRGLTQSVQEDPQSRHVDVHLMQLKEICEDISDHVEQIHALLDTEFSLKLLSYSVNVIVDIHTVQLLWHQLRVSVLVLRERILQGLQDSNGNYTRQTDILQAFTKENQEDRLDALTEVDGSGQLTIRCPSDYLSLDCGITAYELSDYSPRDEEEVHTISAKPLEAWTYNAMQQEFPDLVRGSGLLSVVSDGEQQSSEQENKLASSQMEEAEHPPLKSLPLTEGSTPKRPLQETNDHGGDSPTRPSLPKRGLFLNKEEDWEQSGAIETSVKIVSPSSSLPSSSPAPYNHLALSLSPTCSPVGPSFHTNRLQVEEERAQDMLDTKQMDSQTHQCINGNDSSSDSNLSGCSTPKESQTDTQHHRASDSPPQELGTSSWYGSDEFLALPSHLHEADLLALHLGSLSQLVSPTPEELQPALRDVEDWEISSGSEVGAGSPRCFSPSTPSDLALHANGSGRSTPCLSRPLCGVRQKRAALVQRLMWDIQRQDNDRHVWERIQGFVSKLDRFIRWLQDAMEATENWTPPQPETEALQQYLHTHLNFKQSVDDHCALKDKVLEEGHRLMEVLVSHRPGFLEMLEMITSQWKELQKQIRRQHGWIMSSLDTIKADILQADGDVEEESKTQNGPQSSIEAKRDAVSQMSLQLNSTDYSPSPPSGSTQKPLELSLRSDSMQEMEAECEEFWDWLLDMEATVKNSLGLLVSEDQHLQMCKRCSVEMSLREDRVRALLCQLASLKKEGTPLPDSVLNREGLIRDKWDMLKKSIAEALSTSSPQPVLSPGSGSLVQQLEQRVKELKSWLRDTELTLYNSSLRVDEEGDGRSKERLQKELQRFQSLCSELRLRQRGVASVLRLCRHLLSLQEQSLQQDPPSLQLLSVNLERRWEAIVMQSTQWQRRLQRELRDGQELDVLVDPDWADLSSAGIEEALEWDETDITAEAVCDNQEPECVVTDTYMADEEHHPGQPVSGVSRHSTNSQTQVYQVYSLHNMELFRTDLDSSLRKDPKLGPVSQFSLLQGNTFSSLPDLANKCHQTYQPPKIQGGSSGHSECESGIASGGEGVTAANSEGCLSMDGEGSQGCQALVEDTGQKDCIDIELLTYSRSKHQGPRTLNDCSLLQTNWLEPIILGGTQRSIPGLCFSRKPGQVGTNRTMLAVSSEDHSPEDNTELIEVLSSQNSPHNSSLESLSVTGEGLESEPVTLRRSVSLESWPASYKSNEDLFSQQGSADITPGSEHSEELSKRTLDLLKRLEDIECPSEQKMKRSLSDDITLRSGPHEASLNGLRSPPDRVSSGNEDLGSELTELSSSEELSLKSEDLAMLKGRLMESNASFRKHLSRSLGGEEGEANLSMIVNVSCTSACTDEEDDSDLLSSSTLTLTEEEEEEEEEEELEELNTSVGSEDEAGDGTGLPLGSDFIRRELQAWIRPTFLLPRERRKMNRVVQDMSGAPTIDKIWQSSLHRGRETNGNVKDAKEKDRSKILIQKEEKILSNSKQLADDMENGNIHNRPSSIKDTIRTESHSGVKKKPALYPSVSITKTEKLHPPSMPALAYHKPRELGPSSNRKSNLRVTRDAVADIEMPDNNCIPSENNQKVPCGKVTENTPESSCSCHGSTRESSDSPDCNVHEFVKEILDMASTALHGSPPKDGPSNGTGAQIREKVLEYSRRQLERGDFYSYLSLSSHDSDCGELNGSVRATTPQMPVEDSIDGDIEGMFEACAEDKEKTGDLKASSIVSSPLAAAVSLKTAPSSAGLKIPRNRTTNSGQHNATRPSVRKFQGHPEVSSKCGSSKLSSKILPATRELCPESQGKTSVKPPTSSLPILHKRVHEQRPGMASNSSIGTGHFKKPSHGPKSHKDL
ncbi:A-kinase anchor protein 6 [Spea bombifrons]|uniref:A-kinase anchor protein 6 n=1 Tax=Spea bombifrons TaxID=233779 RepID=UPI002349CF6C|nr:A-kinase anchor protein 6 [Spea bombifrons]